MRAQLPLLGHLRVGIDVFNGVAPLGFGDLRVQEFGSPRDVLVRFDNKTQLQDAQRMIAARVTEALPNVEIVTCFLVLSYFGHSLLQIRTRIMGLIWGARSFSPPALVGRLQGGPRFLNPGAVLFGRSGSGNLGLRFR